MGVTIFSVFMAILWSSVVILIQYAFVKKRYFVKIFGISSVLMICIFAVVRMLVPVEFPFTKEIVNTRLWNGLYTYLCRENIHMFGGIYTRADVLLFIWVTVAAALSVSFAVKYRKSVSEISNLETVYNEQAERILREVIEAAGRPVRVKIITSPSIKVPLGMGIFNKVILIPNQKYSDDEMFSILLHEVTHFINKDIPLKVLIQFFCCFFWWNPLVYLLRKELEQVLEIKCDLSVVEDMGKAEKIKYLSTILRVIKEQGNSVNPYNFESASIAGCNSGAKLVERFKIVSDGKNGGDKLKKAAWHVLFICIILASYSFVIQPEYETPEEEIITDEDTFEITAENTYLIKQNNGKYLMAISGYGEEEISKETAELMIGEGFEVREGE